MLNQKIKLKEDFLAFFFSCSIRYDIKKTIHKSADYIFVIFIIFPVNSSRPDSTTANLTGRPQDQVGYIILSSTK